MRTRTRVCTRGNRVIIHDKPTFAHAIICDKSASVVINSQLPNGAPTPADTIVQLFARATAHTESQDNDYIVHFTGDAFENPALLDNYGQTVMRLLNVADIDHIICDTNGLKFLLLAGERRPPRIRFHHRFHQAPEYAHHSSMVKYMKMLASYQPGVVVVCTRCTYLRGLATAEGLAVE